MSKKWPCLKVVNYLMLHLPLVANAPIGHRHWNLAARTHFCLSGHTMYLESVIETLDHSPTYLCCSKCILNILVYAAWIRQSLNWFKCAKTLCVHCIHYDKQDSFRLHLVIWTLNSFDQLLTFCTVGLRANVPSYSEQPST